MATAPMNSKNNLTPMALLVVGIFAFAVSFPWHARAQTISDIVGTWNMVHDDWPGTLQIFPSDQRLCGIEGSCTYCSWRIGGVYTSPDGRSSNMHGYFQGKDQNRRTSERCKWSANIIKFTIDFNPSKPQPFEGYIFTGRKRTMAGYTWWEGRPFGWYAQKR